MTAPLALLVPCRLESTRFPRKLLHPIKGRPLLHWVMDRLRSEVPDYPVWYAVDHPLLAESVEREGGKALLTSPAHESGTDRLAEANRTVQAQRVINVQADEPLVSRRQIETLARLITRGDAPMATLATPFRRPEDFANPNQVKVVVGGHDRALYFSRAPIPWPRDSAGSVDAAWLSQHCCYRHLGLYAYEAQFLQRYAALPPGKLERIEKLEQLRVLENGHAITVGVTEEPSVGVDTLEDALHLERLLA